MDNTKNDKYYVQLILEDIDKILKYTNNSSVEKLENDEQLTDAILFRLVQMTESIKKLSVKYKEMCKGVCWSDIVGFRNKIVHDYGKTDYSIVYEVITQDLPNLKSVLLQTL